MKKISLRFCKFLAAVSGMFLLTTVVLLCVLYGQKHGQVYHLEETFMGNTVSVNIDVAFLSNTRADVEMVLKLGAKVVSQSEVVDCTVSDGKFYVYDANTKRYRENGTLNAFQLVMSYDDTEFGHFEWVLVCQRNCTYRAVLWVLAGVFGALLFGAAAYLIWDSIYNKNLQTAKTKLAAQTATARPADQSDATPVTPATTIHEPTPITATHTSYESTPLTSAPLHPQSTTFDAATTNMQPLSDQTAQPLAEPQSVDTIAAWEQPTAAPADTTISAWEQPTTATASTTFTDDQATSFWQQQLQDDVALADTAATETDKTADNVAQHVDAFAAAMFADDQENASTPFSAAQPFSDLRYDFNSSDDHNTH